MNLLVDVLLESPVEEWQAAEAPSEDSVRAEQGSKMVTLVLQR